MIKKITFVTFILFFCSVIARDVHAADLKVAPLDLLVEEALNNSPRIKAAYNNWKVQEYRITQKATLPDPVVRYGYFGESVETRVGPQEYKYGASQKIPFPGKLGLKAKAQAKHADMLKQKYEAAKREVIKEIKFIYYDIFWIDKAIQVTEEEKGMLGQLEKVAQVKYESNKGAQADAVKAQVEISKLIDKLFKLSQHRKSSVAKLNSILSRSENRQLEEAEVSEDCKLGYGLNELHKMAEESRQELHAASLDTDRASYEKSLAGLDFMPDFTVGFDYIQVGAGETNSPNDGDDAWMGTVSVNVPIWFNKLGAQLKEKQASLDASKAIYEDVQNRVAFEVEDIYFKINAYIDIVSLHKTALIPQARQVYEANKISYETGKTDFLNWIDSERVLLQTRLAFYKSVVDFHKSVAYLERVVGRNV